MITKSTTAINITGEVDMGLLPWVVWIKKCTTATLELRDSC